MHQKFYFALGFMFVVILITAGSCGTTPPEPKAVLSNLSPNPLILDTVDVGDTIRGFFSFENTGDAALDYTIEFLEPISGSLAPDQSETFFLDVLCEEVGPYMGNLEITSNGGNATLNFEGECEEPITTGSFNVDVRYFGPEIPQNVKNALDDAIEIWNQIILSELPDFEIPDFGSGICGPDEPDLVGEVVDELLILVTPNTTDGAGGGLAAAGPAVALNSSGIDYPRIGCVYIDPADFDNPSMVEILVHELGHVFGIGSLWQPSGLTNRNLLDRVCTSGDPQSFFIGTSAVTAFQDDLGASGNPPIENEYGPGTRCSHWDEEFFDHELMTGFIGGVSNTTDIPLSILTISALEDLGYEVDKSKKEPYTIPACAPNCGALRNLANEPAWEVVLPLKISIDKDGNITFFDESR